MAPRFAQGNHGQDLAKPLSGYQKSADQLIALLKKARYSVQFHKSIAIIIRQENKGGVQKLEMYYAHRKPSLNPWALREDLRNGFLLNPMMGRFLILHLERNNPRPKPPSAAQFADKVLSPAQRAAGLIAGGRLKGNPYVGVIHLDSLAEWMFDEQNWQLLCNPALDNPNYWSSRAANGLSGKKFFRPPNSTELRNWTSSGAANYLRDIAANIVFQIAEMYRDIGYIKSPSSLRMQGAESFASGWKKKILKFRNAWRALAAKSNKSSLLKSRIMVAREGVIQEIWGPITALTNLTGWKYLKD